MDIHINKSPSCCSDSEVLLVEAIYLQVMGEFSHSV